MAIGEPVAFLADADRLRGGDVPGLELPTGPRVTALTVGRIEGFRLGMLAVAIKVASVAENLGAALSVLGRGGSVDPTSGTLGMIAVNPAGV